jgi:twitching motility protein PilT
MQSVPGHSPRPLMEPEEVAEAFNILHSSGELRHFGVSNQRPMQTELPSRYLNQRLIVNQREVNMDCTSYADVLRVSLRQTPDVIFIGEMRDLKTISAAVTAAETGHFVLSTLHTKGAANSINRIVDVFPPGQQQQIRLQL